MFATARLPILNFRPGSWRGPGHAMQESGARNPDSEESQAQTKQESQVRNPGSDHAGI